MSLVSVFGLRMLGLFLILPVFAVGAVHYPGGNDQALVVLALGMGGLTRAMFQFTYGLASDRLGANG